MIRGLSLGIAIALVFVLGTVAWAIFPLSDAGIDGYDVRVVVRFADGATPDAILTVKATAWQPFRHAIGLDDIWFCDFESPEAAEQAHRGLQGNPSVAYVELAQRIRICGSPNDPYYWSAGSWGQSFPDLYGLFNISTADAWDVTIGSSVVVAVVDTGVDYNHPDLAANILRDAGGNVIGWDFYNNDSDPQDDHGHGTHCAGTIGAVGNNALGVVGVNWIARIMPVKFLNAQGSGWSTDAAEAIVWATDHGARIMSNSWGSTGYSELLRDAMRYAHQRGVVFVAAAGNSNACMYGFYPADNPEAIAVAAFDSNDNKATFSNYGPQLDVAAPGVEILSLKSAVSPMCTAARTVGVDYCVVSGTSMACPHVAGLAALILSANPNLTNEQVRQCLRRGADDVGSPGWDVYSGHGRINAHQALLVEEPLECRIVDIREEAGILEIAALARGSGFSGYEIAYSQGRQPGSWATLLTSDVPAHGELILSFPRSALPVPMDDYCFRLRCRDAAGRIYDDIDMIIGLGSISGEVIHAITGAPMAGVEIAAHKSGSSTELITYTDASGDFEYPQFEAGVYLLKACADGFLCEHRCGTLAPRGAVHVAMAMTPVDAAGLLTGTLMDVIGSPLPNTMVSVSGDGFWRSDRTDSLGRFGFADMHLLCSYMLHYIASDNGCSCSFVRHALLFQPAEQVDYPFLVSCCCDRAGVYGNVYTSEDREFLPWALIEVLRDDGVVAWARSNLLTATYRIELPAGSYTVRASAPDRRTESEAVILAAGNYRPINWYLRPVEEPPPPPPPQYGTIRGTVIDADGDPIDRAKVTGLGPVRQQTRTAGDGTFRLYGLPIGRYTVSAQYRGAKANVSVLVEPDEITNVSLTLTK